ncbi:antA/AntB antirepressor family protein [Marinobacter sp. CA1]|uniref:antA/AntB antirepressor family protein n=1 Tax=Marinobacter sp. CA1 TaxID=2817656 RepID=UPI001D097B0A|nr:antA/AntB antirepressor family protein [Marinobacter sp. CA1]UDL03982.1 antA/AntB antirepressor family protein [Marinobacter sp. CA1]
MSTHVEDSTIEVIPVFAGSINNEKQQMVDARALHRFLEVDARFNDWISRRIAEYGFSAGEDFYSELSKSTGGRRRREFCVTLDMAKELSMVERNDRGRQARRYFIECEKRLRQVAPEDAASIGEETIGVAGLQKLKALVRGKVANLPAAARRSATAKLWSQTHSAFGVRSAADIPADQLDSARNFVAAYAIEGEFIEAGKPAPGITLAPADEMKLHVLLAHYREAIRDLNNLYIAYQALESKPLLRVWDHLHEGKPSYLGLVNSLGSALEASYLHQIGEVGRRHLHS